MIRSLYTILKNSHLRNFNSISFYYSFLLKRVKINLGDVSRVMRMTFHMFRIFIVNQIKGPDRLKKVFALTKQTSINTTTL